MSLEKKTTNDQQEIADSTVKAWEIVGDSGYDDTLLRVIEELDRSIPDDFSKTDLAASATWLTLRMLNEISKDMEVDAVQWDYTTIVLTGGFMGRHKEELKRSALEEQLDQLGSEGYELCWVLMDQALQHEKDGHVLIFKRAVE